MSAFPGSPRLLRGGLVLIDPDTAAVLRIIALQYNPDTLTRSLQIKGDAARSRRPPRGACGSRGRRSRRSSSRPRSTPPTSSRRPMRRRVELGLHPQLAALEMIVYPSSALSLRHQYRGPVRHARDRARRRRRCRSSSSAQAHPAGADHRAQHHRGGVRPGAQPDPRQGQPGMRVLTVDDLGFDVPRRQRCS